MKTIYDANILVLDDQKFICELLKEILHQSGFHNVQSTTESLKGVSLFQEKPADLILLDLMMPVMDGIEACSRIRENPDNAGIYIVFLTARSEEYSELAGFNAGADDYIAKPIKPRLLLSRVKAILKRDKHKDQEEQSIEAGELVINRSTYTVQLGDKELNLPKKEFELLYLLASKPGKVFTRESILSKVWGDDVYVVDRTIDVHIRKIREKIGDKKIKTVKGVGYKFELWEKTLVQGL